MKNRPAVKVLAPYLAGIILADRFNLSMIHLWTLSAIFMIPLLVLYKRRHLSSSSALLVLSFLSIGFLRYEIAMIPPRGLDEVLYQQVKVRGNITKSQKARSRGSSLIVRGEASPISDPSISMTGEIEIRSWEDVFPQKYGDVVEIEGRLSRPRLPRNPGGFDYRKYLMRHGVFATMTINDPSHVETIGTGGNVFLKWIKGLRWKIEKTVGETMPCEESASILKGITLGAREELSPETYEKFLRTGISHILAVSGLHIGIIAGWTFMLCNWTMKRIRLKTGSIAHIPVIPLIIVYASMVGFRTSVVRASILVILAVLAVVINRDRGASTVIDLEEDDEEHVVDLLNLLAIAALCVLIYRPGAFWDVGFQLSFGTVASISYLMPHWRRWIGRIRRDKWYLRSLRVFLQTVTISLSAQVGAMLIIAYSFRKASLTGILANPVIIPLVALIVPVAFAMYLMGFIYPPLAAILAHVNHLLIHILTSVASYFAGLRWSYVPLRLLSSFWHIIIGVAIVVFAANLFSFMEKRRRLAETQRLSERRRLMIAGLGVAAISIFALALSYDGHVLKVTYLDVGQGDSAFVELPNGDNILIDGGPYSAKFDTGERVVYPFLQHEGIGKVDLIVSTHPHNDHAGGLTYTVDHLRVGEVITGNYGLTTPTFAELRARLDRKGIEYRDAQMGTILKDGELCVEVVGPQLLCTSEDENTQMNENSIVLRVTYKGVSFLFASDISERSERLLIDSGRDIKSAILKVPHHGSGKASRWEFLRTVQPIMGVISVGWRNSFRHPSRMILGRYNWLGIKTYRTDRQGAITIVTDGRHGWVKTRL
ncbi:DNA internalization-related competence protein ComEC/Rec2 [Candidatus Poribacteria bacterium]